MQKKLRSGKEIILPILFTSLADYTGGLEMPLIRRSELNLK
jgi:hypothetical protein